MAKNGRIVASLYKGGLLIMVRTREELLRFFSDELIDAEVNRVKAARVGSTVYTIETWENSDFVDSILSYASIKTHVVEVYGLAKFIKD